MAIVSCGVEELQQLGPFCVLYSASAYSSKVKETLSARGLRSDLDIRSDAKNSSNLQSPPFIDLYDH